MPVTQLASLEAPRELVEQRPVSRVGSEEEGNAFLPEEVPVVPVYPPKQARN
jgi:hypothetical protein